MPTQKENRILIVDDCDVNQALVQQYLERAGYFVEIAENGHQALETLKSKRFDLILMDLVMPVMDGYETARRIRNAEGGRRNEKIKQSKIKSKIQKVPIIGMSGHDPESVMEKCCQAGMNDCIGKPLQRELLVSVMRKWTRGDSDIPQNKTTTDEPGQPHSDRIEHQPPIDIEKTMTEFMGKTDLLQEVLKSFKTRVRAQIMNMKQHLSRNNFNPILSEAHAIKGGAGNLGAFNLSQAAADLEEAAGEESSAKANAAMDDLEKEFHRLYHYLEQSDMGRAI